MTAHYLVLCRFLTRLSVQTDSFQLAIMGCVARSRNSAQIQAATKMYLQKSF